MGSRKDISAVSKSTTPATNYTSKCGSGPSDNGGTDATTGCTTAASKCIEELAEMRLVKKLTLFKGEVVSLFMFCELERSDEKYIPPL